MLQECNAIRVSCCCYCFEHFQIYNEPNCWVFFFSFSFFFFFFFFFFSFSFFFFFFIFLFTVFKQQYMPSHGPWPIKRNTGYADDSSAKLKIHKVIMRATWRGAVYLGTSVLIVRPCMSLISAASVWLTSMCCFTRGSPLKSFATTRTEKKDPQPPVCDQCILGVSSLVRSSERSSQGGYVSNS